MRVSAALRSLVIVVSCVVGLVLSPTGSDAASTGAPLATGATAVAAGFEHTCALTTAGAVQCWGHNQFGQVGNSSASTQVLRPAPVSGLSSGVASIAAGEDHTCAVLLAGSVRCWGSNTWGMLGDGTVVDARTPVAVVGLRDVRLVAPGGSHSCALTSTGRVWCWGLNEAGELGDGTTTQSLRPRQVVGLPRPAVDVATGVHHTCAVLDDRSVWCWGWNFYGQLGTPNHRDTGTPTRVTMPPVEQLSARLTTSCATTTAGLAYCWGTSGWFVGDTQEDLVPTRVEGIGAGASATAPGYSETCGIVEGAARCWGQSYENVGLGDGRTLGAWVPVTVRGLGRGVRAIDTNYFHQCAVDAARQVRCWGGNGFGQLGNGTTTESRVPVVAGLSSTTPAGTATGLRAYGAQAVRGPNPDPASGAARQPRLWDSRTSIGRTAVTTGVPTTARVAATEAPAQPHVAQVAVGTSHTCARSQAGALYCWGSNIHGQVGVPETSTWGPYFTPQRVPGMASGVSWVSTGNQHTCVVKDAQVWCWGANDHHQASPSDSTDVMTPQRYTALSEPVRQVEAGYFSTCALTVSGAVKCWGTDYNGLGDGHTESSAAPVQVRSLTSGVTSISTNDGTCAVLASGEMRCWGFGRNGELGNGSTANSPVPVTVVGLGGVVTRVTRGGVTCAVVSVGTKCWGYGRGGELGNGQQSNALTPTLVTGLGAGVKSISSGTGTCAVLSDGRLTCWGSNAYGIGNPSVYGTLLPATVPVGAATQVDLSSYGGCVALTAGGASCWGWNGDGELGAGLPARFSRVPVRVVFP